MPDIDVLAIDASIVTTTGSPSFGVTANGFVPKPYGRLIAEKIALAQALVGPDIDVTPGSPFRALLEIAALEEARCWSTLASAYDDRFVVSAKSVALSRLGDELGITRPFNNATGTIALTLTGALPAGTTTLTIPSGARLSTPGGHHISLDADVVLSAASTKRDATVTAFYPGPSHNLDPANANQKIDRWNGWDAKLADFVALGGPGLVTIAHTLPLTGGELQWDDVRFRALLLAAPRSVWTVDAVRLAVSLVPGVRQVAVRDGVGGLDIEHSIFGDFAFVERLFSSDRDLGSPYYFTVLIATTVAAIWDGPDGVAAQTASAIDDLRPIGIFPRIVAATQVGVGLQATLVVSGLPIPGGTKDAMNAASAAVQLKARLFSRIAKYVDALAFGEPVRVAEITWTLMNEPGVSDVQGLRLLRYPPRFERLDFLIGVQSQPEVLECGANVVLGQDEIAVAVQDDTRLMLG